MPPATGRKKGGALRAEGAEPPSGVPALHETDRGYHWPRWVIGPISISYPEALRGFGGYHGLGRSAGEGVERQAPQPGEDRGGEVPHAANPPAALLTGGVSGLVPRGGLTAFPADPPRLRSRVAVDSGRR